MEGKVYTKQEMLENALRSNLNSGRWRAGDKLPSESELMRQYNVSRTLVRTVLTSLIHDGLIVSRQGKGSFVTTPGIHVHAPYKEKIRDQLERQGYVVKTQFFTLHREPTTPKLALILKMAAGEEVYVHKHIRFVDDQPFSISESYMPTALFPDLEHQDMTDTPLSEVFDRVYGYTVCSASETLEILYAPKDVAQWLDVAQGFPVLTLEQINYSENNVPFELNRIFFRADRTRLHFDYNR